MYSTRHTVAPLCLLPDSVAAGGAPEACTEELDKFMGEMQYGLFHGEGVRQCGLGARPFRFSHLLQAIPVSIHVNVILFSTILVVLTMVGTAFFMYNAFGKPFETLHGPLGLYLLSFISAQLNASHKLAELPL
ncbi:hypothetical protein GH733_002717 [Mirounga leonina]|nr:hypothetical protein GH733_002717 [Mirounga leonina]